MAYYSVCPVCLGTLDPGEKCDCQREKERRRAVFSKEIKANPLTGQYAFCWEEEAGQKAEPTG